MVRSVKNAFTPISRIPQGILSLIPGHCDTDKEFITATHVCRGWREQFTSRSSLWTPPDCTNLDRTRVYPERSKTSLLEICLGEEEHRPFLNDTFLLTIPHLGRFNNLTITGSSNDLVGLTNPFLHRRAPLLQKLKIHSTSDDSLTIPAAIFNGILPSLHRLSLSGILTNLP